MFRPAFNVCLLVACSMSAAFGQGLSPDEAVKRMKVADGFEVSVVASEPLVRQPVAIEFDDRGRLWVIQYFAVPESGGAEASAGRSLLADEI